MFGKPKFGDTDEEILKQQEEYYKQKSENKIKVSTKYFTATRDEQNRNTNDNNVSSNEDVDKNHGDQNVLPEKLVIGKIIERKNTNDIDFDDTIRFKNGFPKATRRKVSKTSSSRSIFAQQSKRFESLPRNEPQRMEVDPKPSTSIDEFVSTEKLQARLKNFPSKSFILKGDEKDEIHQENLDKLKEMTEDEIIEERNALINALDPDIIKFFKSKRNEMEPVTEKDEDTMDFKEDVVEPEEIDTAKDIIEKSDKWLNFGRVETEKLQWMKNIVVPEKLKDDETYEARFDFDGWLLPYVESEITEKNRVLYHHGKESGRPGYSLQELFKLCRSNVQQQRILALNTISNILAVNLTGVYENVIDVPIEQIFFVVRIAIDDNTPAVLNAALKAMTRLFCSQIDEICLDTLLGFGCSNVQPILTVEKQKRNREDVEEEKEINDQKMAELDLVKCLMRTDILIRIRYIINTVRPSIETVTYCLELLIRILRDSNDAFNQVIECDDLVPSIIRNFLPKIYRLKLSTSAYDSPQLSAIKLMRIVACRNKAIGNILEKYGVLESISSYISNDIGSNIIGVRIQTESMNLLGVYLNYNLKIECYTDVLPFLLRNLEYHFNQTSINENVSYAKQSHFSAIVNVIKRAANINFKLIEIFLPILRKCCTKYFQQVSILTDFKCGALQIISSLFSSLTKNAESFTKEIVSLIKSNGFDKITKNIKNGSNLLCGYESLKSGSNLKFIEAVVWKTSEHVVPVLLTSSSIPFLRALSFTIVESSNEVKLEFIQHPNVIKYLKSLKITSKFSLTNNWFTKIETQLLMNIFRCVVDVSGLLPDTMFFYELIVKCIGLFGSELRSDVDYVLKNVVFNRSFYSNEILLKELSIGNTEDDVINSLKYLDEIYDCYTNFMGLKSSSEVIKNLSLDVRIGNIVPIDWMYSPIIIMYSQSEEQKNDSERCRLLTRCLQWIFLYETNFPMLSSLINTTDRFCRLCCVFLASNSLFLEEGVQKLLKNTLDLLLMPDNYKEINFDREIKGLNNFQDFYTELLEHYQGVSYGDKLFANFVLVPLAQRHNIKWRKVLWSEYEGVTQIINLTEEECVLSINEFIEPMETDLSVLDCYRRSLTSGHLNRSPLLKKIAVYHVESHFKNKRLKK